MESVFVAQDGGDAGGLLVTSASSSEIRDLESWAALTESGVSEPPSRRAPRSSDDETKGYVVGDYWIDHKKALFQATRVTAGLASWRRITLGALPADLAACYAERRLVPGYAGKAKQIQRASDDATLDIGFLADGSVDKAAEDAFVIGTTAKVIIWYDQTANGYDATAATTFRPDAIPFDYVGNARGVQFSNSAVVNGIGGKIKNAMTIPVELELDSRDVSIVGLASFGHGTRNSPLVELSGVKPFCFGNCATTGISALAIRHDSAFKTFTGERPPITPAVYGAISSASGVTMYHNERSSGAKSAYASNALAGGLIGGTTLFVDGASDPDYGYNTQAAVLIFDRAITADEYQGLVALLHAEFEVPPQTRGIIVCDGDSIVEGSFGTYLQSWPRRMESLLQRPAVIYNVANGGGTFSTQTSFITSRWNGLYNDANPFNKLVISVGTNDLAADHTAATVYADLQTYLTTVRTAGWAGEIYGATIMPRGGFVTGNREANRLAYNALLRANWAALGLTGIIDIASDPTMGAAGVYNDDTLFGDTTHPNDGGIAYEAQIFGEALDYPAVT
jgi:hypothetical protein